LVPPFGLSLLMFCKALQPMSRWDGNTRDIEKLHADEFTPLSDHGAKLPGSGMRNARLLSESGLYKLVMRSDKPEAKAFQDWMTREVLPAIRKVGMYVMGDTNLN
jgi:prophage antirepressor-like protein